MSAMEDFSRTVAFKMSQETFTRLQLEAQRDYRSVSSFLRVLIEDCLPDYCEKLRARHSNNQEDAR